jgi:hypothetical protein
VPLHRRLGPTPSNEVVRYSRITTPVLMIGRVISGAWTVEWLTIAVLFAPRRLILQHQDLPERGFSRGSGNCLGVGDFM